MLSYTTLRAHWQYITGAPRMVYELRVRVQRLRRWEGFIYIAPPGLPNAPMTIYAQLAARVEAGITG